MTFREIFRFEFTYQVRRVSTWLYVAFLTFIAFVQTVGNFLPDARSGGYLLNAPVVIAYVTAIVCLVWTLVAAYVAGAVATRDAETGMAPLTHVAPLRKADYLGGRFLAAFALNALILLAVPLGILLGTYAPEVESWVRGPFRPAAYLMAYVIIAVPNAFVTTAVQLSFATLSRRAVASYLGGLLILMAAAGSVFLAENFGLWTIATLIDPTGLVLVDEVLGAWTPVQKNTQLVGLDGAWLLNRLLWIGLALGMLAFTHSRFRFAHRTASTWWSHIRRRRAVHTPAPVETEITRSAPLTVPQVRLTFGFTTHTQQTLAIAWASFWMIARSRGGLLFSALIVVLAGLFLLDQGFMGVPVVPRADRILRILTTPVAGPGPWLLIPLLTVFWAGELVWREREAGLSEIVDATPVSGGVLFLGKFMGLSLVLVAWMILLMVTGLLVQISIGVPELEIGLYVQILLGLELVDYLLIALFAIAGHAVVHQKPISHLIVLVTLFAIAYAYGNKMGNSLLIPGTDPRWSYTNLDGFDASLGPWLWFKLYWAAWALLLGIGARLLWVRGKEERFKTRLQMARRRFTRPTAWAAAGAGGLVLALGGFIFYNTHVLNDYQTAKEQMAQRAEYERRYGSYSGILQPQMTTTKLRVELYPERRAMEVQGTYHLVNNAVAPIDSIHLATEVEPQKVAFDRSARLVLEDKELGHRIFAFDQPLQSGDSLRLDFEMHVAPRGFQHRGNDAPVGVNATWFTNRDWLPAIGYQRRRELRNAGDRRAHGLEPRPIRPLVYDVEKQPQMTGAERITFDAIVGTEADQVAIAPGVLRRTWTEGERRYFHYATDAPIGNEYAFFSADYAIREAQWEAPATGARQGVAIQIFHHPAHTANLDRMIRSIQASLSHYTEQFGPYPYSHIRLIERSGLGYGMHADAHQISYDEGFSTLRPADAPQGLDLPFYVVAHEVAHQWWGTQLTPAFAEGAGVLVENLASYSAYQVVEKTYGPKHLRRLFDQLRRAYQVPRTRAAAPLLQATDPFLYYRKGPFALYAMSKYVGEERVNLALRRLLEAHRSGTPPLPTTLDLYRELQVVTPDSLQSLLHDLFKVNLFWELETERATAEQTESGIWQVTLDVQARKLVVDSAGVETEMPIDEWVQIGVFAPAAEGRDLGEPLYRRKHRLHSAKQTIIVMVPRQPAHAGIDPYHLLIDLEIDNNVEEVRNES